MDISGFTFKAPAKKAEDEPLWKTVFDYFDQNFGPDITVDGIVFVIGVQELGKGYQKFSKDQKLDIMHVAICTLLEPYGYYEFEGNDADGWPHWKRNDKLPYLNAKEQEKLLKQAIVEYAQSNGLVG